MSICKDYVGNRTASHQGSSYSHQAFNRLVSANGTSFGLDTNGNLISKTDGAGTWTYSWDHENRLQQAALSGGVTVSYSYDAFGRRVQRSSTSSGTTRFVYDGDDVVRDLDGSGATVADYVNSLGIDEKLRQTSSGASHYFLTDHLETTRALTDASGNITSSLSFDSFGNVTGSSPTRYTYTGREFDSDTGLFYYRARFYESQQGRFVSEDPIGFEGGRNFYVYVENNPLNLVDPEGLKPSFYDCITRCAAQQLGIRTVVGAAGAGGGLPLVKKDRGSIDRGNASRRTSPISKYLSARYPQKMSRARWAPTLRHPIAARTNILGRFVGRWIPWIGWGLLAYDGIKIDICVNDCQKGDC